MPLRSGLEPKLRPQYRPQPRPSEKGEFSTCVHFVLYLNDDESDFAGVVPSRTVFAVSGARKLPIVHTGGVYISKKHRFGPNVSMVPPLRSTANIGFTCTDRTLYVALS